MNYQSNPILTPNPSDVEVITVPRERTFWKMLLGAPDGTLLDEARQTAMLDKYRAALTHNAILNATAFSVLEAQAAAISPQGAARVGALADAYTMKSIKTITGR